MKFREYLENMKGKRVTVVGAGISNIPLIEALLSVGVDTTVCDMRTVAEMEDVVSRFGSLGAKFSLGDGYLDNISADVIFRTPGLMPSHPSLEAAVRNGAVLTSEMEAFFEVCPCKKIGITGSDGKTTTTSIIAQLLKNEGLTVHVGGNIGNPLLCGADEICADDIAVLELSSFQLISMKKCPEVAVVTNLTPNHLDVHKDMKEYVGAKRNIFIRQSSTDIGVFNLDYDVTRAYAGEAPGHVRLFSRRSAVSDGVCADVDAMYGVFDDKREKIMPIREILLPGVHNVENYLAAFAATWGMVSRDTMVETARTFAGVAHRIEMVRERDGVRYYNDSIASSPSRTIAGLRSFEKEVILIAGGKGKGIPFDELGAEIVSRVKILVLTGAAAGQIKDAVERVPGYAGVPEIIMKEDFEKAVIAAAESAERGDVVLLSPACTSFDRFKNFEERGNVFTEIVKGL